MGKLAAVARETAKPSRARDRPVGDGGGLFLRIRPNGTKAWMIEFDFKGERRKYTIGFGLYVPNGAPGASIGQWLLHVQFGGNHQLKYGIAVRRRALQTSRPD